jgi:DNA-binding MarR family transcriptional regulator
MPLSLDNQICFPLYSAANAVVRARSSEDERVRIISLTKQGTALKKKAQSVPERFRCEVNMPPEQALQLKGLCQQLLGLLD